MACRRSASWSPTSRSGGTRRALRPGKASRTCGSGRRRPFPQGHLAAVTETGAAAGVTESAGRIWAELARRYGPSLVLLEHQPAPEDREGAETLDVVRIAADGSARWTRVWPTPEDNPRHAGLELWMAAHGHQIVSKPVSWSDRCEDQEG